MPRDPNEIKSMPLYRDVDRIYDELRAAGLEQRDELTVADLAPFDQYHYHGTAAVDVAIRELGIEDKSRILEIGAGIGGPARYLAATTGAHVTALELQPDLNETAKELTRHCGLGELVDHVCTDVMDFDTGSKFDVIVSWLALFHIADRRGLLSRCSAWLGGSGRFLVEDLYARNEPTPAERDDLDKLLYSRYLPDMDTYICDFRDAGFLDLEATDMSADWSDFTGDRYKDFCTARERHDEVHGTETAEGLDRFYGTVSRLFADGNLGGIRLKGRLGV